MPYCMVHLNTVIGVEIRKSEFKGYRQCIIAVRVLPKDTFLPHWLQQYTKNGPQNCKVSENRGFVTIKTMRDIKEGEQIFTYFFGSSYFLCSS
jgi:hypothetical protein